MQRANAQVAKRSGVGSPSSSWRCDLVQDLRGKERRHHVLYRRFVHAAHVQPQERSRVDEDGSVNGQEYATARRRRSPSKDHWLRGAECNQHKAHCNEHSHIYRQGDAREECGPRQLGGSCCRCHCTVWVFGSNKQVQRALALHGASAESAQRQSVRVGVWEAQGSQQHKP